MPSFIKVVDQAEYHTLPSSKSSSVSSTVNQGRAPSASKAAEEEGADNTTTTNGAVNNAVSSKTPPPTAKCDATKLTMKPRAASAGMTSEPMAEGEKNEVDNAVRVSILAFADNPAEKEELPSSKKKEIEIVELEDDSDDDDDLDDLPLEVLQERMKAMKNQNKKSDQEPKSTKETNNSQPAKPPAVVTASSTENTPREIVAEKIVHAPESPTPRTGDKAKGETTKTKDGEDESERKGGAGNPKMASNNNPDAEGGSAKETAPMDGGTEKMTNNITANAPQNISATTSSPPPAQKETTNEGAGNNDNEGNTETTASPVPPESPAATTPNETTNGGGRTLRSSLASSGIPKKSTDAKATSSTTNDGDKETEDGAIAPMDTSQVDVTHRAKMLEAEAYRLATEHIKDMSQTADHSTAPKPSATTENGASIMATDCKAVLPEIYTNGLLEKMKELAQMLAELEHKNGGKDIFYWHILSDTNIQLLSQRVPTTAHELYVCQLSDRTIRLYGQSIIASVIEYVRAFRLQRYLTDEKEVGDSSVGMVGMGKEVLGVGKDATSNAPVERGGGSKKTNGNDMVLPSGYTMVLKRKLTAVVDSWAKEEQMKGLRISCEDILNSATIASIANSIPTSMGDLGDCYVGFETLKKYGERIIEFVSDFVQHHKLEVLLTKKVNNGTKEGLSVQSAGVGLILPKSHTLALQAMLMDKITQSKALTKEDISLLAMLLASRVPLTMEELARMGLPKPFLNRYSIPLLDYIKAFITTNNLQWYVDSKALKLGSRPSVTAAAANAQSVGTAASTVAQPVQRLSNPNTAGYNVGVGQQKKSQPSPPSATNRPSQSQGQRTNQVAGRERERWSEYRIDAASSVNELEVIRRRLLTLVDRVDDRLKNKRLAEALDEIGDKKAAPENVEELTTMELMSRLNEEVEKSITEAEDGGDSGINNNPPSNEGKNADGKRNASEVLGDADMADGDNKRPCLSTACPLCFEKIESPSAGTGTCEICEETNLCEHCLSKCTRCGRSTCDDCLMVCDNPCTRYHCSDCMMIGDGKCVVCQPKKAAKRKPNHHNVNAISHLRHANEIVGYPNFACPAQLASQQTSFRQTYGYPANQTASAPRQQVHHSYPQRNHIQPSHHSTRTMAQTVANMEKSAAHARSQYSYPPAQTIPGQPAAHAMSQYSYPPPPANTRTTLPTHQNVANNANLTQSISPTPSKLYSIHRFIITQEGIIGLSLTQIEAINATLISTVNPSTSSLALNYGVRANDEVLPPYSTGKEPPNTYQLFLNATKNRPIMFEVKRPFPQPDTNPYALQALQSLHRFVIMQPGTLGMSLGKKMNGITFVNTVTPNSLAEHYGLHENDIICKPCTNGAEKMDIEGFFKEAIKGSRPLIIEVLRGLPTPTTEGTMHMWQQSGTSANQNPFIFTFPPPTSTPQKDSEGEEVPAQPFNQSSTVQATTTSAVSAAGKTAKSSTIENFYVGKKATPIICIDDDSADEGNGEEKKKDSD